MYKLAYFILSAMLVAPAAYAKSSQPVVSNQLSAYDFPINALPPGSTPPELWQQQAKPKYIVELTGAGLYTALQQQAMQQINYPTSLGDTAAQQQTLKQTMQKLAMDSTIVTALRQQIEFEQNQVIQAVQQLPGAQVERQFSQLVNWLLVTGDVTHDQLAALPGVTQVWPEQIYQVTLTESVPQVKAPQVWAQKDQKNLQITGQGVKIAVLDTGVDHNHPALGGCLGSTCKVIRARNTIVNSDDAADVHGHGTHVAATAAGKTTTGNGVAPDAQIIAVKVLNDQGWGNDSGIVAGIEFAVDPDGNPATDDGADIINMSLGGPGDAQSPISKASESAVKAGVTVVVAAGNGGRYLAIGSPAAAPSVITVANTARDDKIHSSSSRGPLEGADYLKPEIAAPGTNIEAAKPGGGLQRMTGTSMASPHVAGAAALLLQAQPNLTPMQLKQKLMQSADLIKAAPAETGSGRLNVLSALSQTYTLRETTLSLGRVPNDPTIFSGNRQVTFNNPTDQTVQVSARVNGQFEEDLEISILNPVQQVAANSSVKFDIQFKAQSNDIEFPDNSAGVAGFQLIFDVGSQRLTLPVWYEKYQALYVQTDGHLHSLFLFDVDFQEYATSQWFYWGIKENKTIRMQNLQNISKLLAHFFLPDPKNNLKGNNIQGFLLLPIQELVSGDVQLNISSSQLKEYHHLSEVKLPAGTTEPHLLSAVSSVALLHNQEVLPLPFYQWTNCYEDCGVRPFAFMTAGFDNSNWQFFQSFTFANLSDTAPESWLLSWQGPLGQGSQKGSIEFSEKNLLKFNLVEGQQPFSGFVCDHNWWLLCGIHWPLKAKAGDVMKVYQSGPLLLPSTTSQVGGSFDYYTLGSLSGAFTASNTGSIVKWQLNDSGPRYLVPAVDFRTNSLPLSSSLKMFSGSVNVSNNRKILQVQQAPRNNYDELNSPAVWHDQFLNVAYFPRHTVLSNKCSSSWAQNWWDWMWGVWRIQSSFCRELTISTDNEQTKLLRFSPTLQYTIGKDGEMPRLINLALFNGGKQSDTISRLDHRLDFAIANLGKQVTTTKVVVDFRTDAGKWRTIYEKSGSTTHSLRLPLSEKTLQADLRIKVIQPNGNVMTQMIPQALTIGANADNVQDVDSDGIPNTLDTDNDNDGVEDSHDAYRFDPTQGIDNKQDGTVEYASW